VKAFVKLKIGATITPEQLIEYSRQFLAPYKLPKEIEILSDLPKSSVGKLLRRMLRQEENHKLHS
jgi:long-chain acyl-CoA synthetase